MRTYKDLDVWKESKDLVVKVYLITKDYPNEELFGLKSQIRRSATSVPSNIAEGCGRSSSKETVHFLHISRGSIYELETQLIISNELNYISGLELKNILSQIESCKKLINGFINYYKKLQ